MKQIFVTLAIALFSFAIYAQDAAPKIVFEKSSHNFGNIQEANGDASCEFKFKNEGNAPLIITRATSGCGCTAPSFPKAPIAPGDSGVIGATYHAKGRPGGFSKVITLYTNVPDEKIKLTSSGHVIPELK